MKRSNIFLALFWMFLISGTLLFWDTVLFEGNEPQAIISVSCMLLAMVAYGFMMKAVLREDREEGK